MFKRKLYQTLLDWKAQSAGKSAMLIEGARRVGKTTLVQEFAKQEYENSIYIDFSKTNKATLDLFRNHRDDTDTFLRLLQLNFSKRLTPRRSVVIFDEVQQFPMAREFIKHLVADGRFDYIETGSLISIRKNVSEIVIPSEEDRATLHPFDFEEYLWALDKELLAEEIRRARNDRRPLPDSIHAQCMRYFNEYMLVGGMPQSVAAFAEEADFTGCETVKRRILNLYREDIAKFGGADARRARAIFQEIPGQLSGGSKRFKFSSLGNSVRYANSESAVIWLEDSHLANICRQCNDPNIGFRLTANESMLKCYMADTGLLVTHTFADGPESLEVQRAVQFGKISINKGMLVENVIAQQLAAAGHSLFFYTWDEPSKTPGTKPRTREIDFLIVRGFSDAAGKPKVCPIEVKSSKTYSTISLDDFASRFKKRVGDMIVLHPKQLKVEAGKTYLPLYMSFCV